jgi:subtilase family serine protease
MKLRSMASLLAALLASVLAVVTASGTSGASTPVVPALTVPLPGAAQPLPGDAVALGSVAGPTVLHLDVTLKVRDPAALAAFIQQLSDRSAPHFGQFLRPGQFGPMFGATLAQVAAVDTALRAEGLSPGPVTRNRLAIPVTTSAAVAERAFGLTLTRYRLAGGRIAYSNSRAPRLPAAAAPFVQGVLGLSDAYLPESLAVRPAPPSGRPARAHAMPDRGRTLASAAAGPKPCTAASNSASANGSFTADQLAEYYAMSPLYGLGDRGKGVNVALAEFEPDMASDIAAYRTCYGIKTAVTYTKVDGGAGTGAGTGEAALDIEDVMGLAPGVAIHVYQAPNGGTQDTFDLYNTIISNDTSQVVSTSWGLCQPDSGSSLISSEASVFAEAATQGQTVFAAAGDDGSTDCYTGSGSSTDLAVQDPASQPYVIGVGGTSVGTNAETVWNDSSFADGAGGGGRSANCMPAYQDQAGIPGLITTTYSEKSSSCTKVPYLRQVPDVSADADPETGYTYFHSAAWSAIGGTSAAAPLWAAVAALTDASPFCKYYGSGDAGLRPPGLYAMAANDHAYIYDDGEALHDITQGNNDYTPSGYTAGLFPATPGYDMASGLGTPLAVGVISGQVSTFYPGITALMCWQYGKKLRKTTVTGISPRAGPASKRQTITITGTGFLPVAGADLATVGARTVSARCSTTTKCTVTLPVLKAGTYSIQIKAEDLTLSPVTAATHYRAVAAPVVSSISPTQGRPGGGNTVTIHGSHFVGVTAVHFGSKKASHFVVISATKITVTAPSGSATVAVTVTATGGTSAISAGSHYRY